MTIANDGSPASPRGGRGPAIRAFTLAATVLAGGTAIVVWFVVQHNKLFPPGGFVFVVGPYILTAAAAVARRPPRPLAPLAVGAAIVFLVGVLIAAQRRGSWSGWAGLGLGPLITGQYAAAVVSGLVVLLRRGPRAPGGAGVPPPAGMGRARIGTLALVVALVGAYAAAEGWLGGLAGRIARLPYTGPGAPLPLPPSEYLKPEYLAADRLERNLLKDPSFEQVPLKAWTNPYPMGRCDATAVATDVSRSGRASLMYRSAAGGYCSVGQTVSLKRHTWYLLSGWVKAKVESIDDRSNGSAVTSVVASDSFGILAQPADLRSTDWQDFATVFNSSTSNTAWVSVHFGAPATGTAWFDDLVLIELP
jgi:hypothetical protein